MAKQATVKKVNARDVKRAQDKDDLETLEAKAGQPVSDSSLSTITIFFSNRSK